MSPVAWFVIGAAVASLPWMAVVAWLLDRFDLVRRQRDEADATVREQMAQTRRMARLVVDLSGPRAPVKAQPAPAWVSLPGRWPS